MEAAKTPKQLKEMPYPPQKKKDFKKKGKKYYTRKDKCPSFTSFFRMPKICPRENIFDILRSLCQLMTLNVLLKLTKEKITLHEVNFGRAAKIYAIFYQ